MFTHLTYLILFVSYSYSAKILAVFPTTYVSHQAVFRPFTLELIKRGHSVTVITPRPIFEGDNAPDNLHEIDVYNISKDVIEDLVTEKFKYAKDVFTQTKLTWDALSSTFDLQLQSEEVKKLISGKEEFDLVITEACVRPAIVFGFIFDVPVIEFSSFGSVFGTMDLYGAASHPLLYPIPLRDDYESRSIIDKISELYSHYTGNKVYKNSEDEENEMLKRHFGSDLPSLSEIRKRYVHMMFVNLHPIWDGNRPVPPNVIYLGGMPSHSSKALPKEIKTVLDSSTAGAIYVSFGTNVHSTLITSKIKEVFKNVFSNIPYTIIWKLDEKEEGLSRNIKVYKWLPQADVLGHPNIKLFITQGGLQSTDEAINAGVPLIGIPMLWDQKYNVKKYEELEIGVKIQPDDLTEELLLNAIQAIVREERYRQNVKNLRRIMRDEPETALERAVWWTEYMLRHKSATHLQARGANMTVAEYYNLDLVAIIIVMCIILIAMIGASVLLCKAFGAKKKCKEF